MIHEVRYDAIVAQIVIFWIKSLNILIWIRIEWYTTWRESSIILIESWMRLGNCEWIWVCPSLCESQQQSAPGELCRREQPKYRHCAGRLSAQLA